MSATTDAILPRTPRDQIASLYRLLEVFDRLARRIHLEYWLTEGSCLGAVRHEGIIPWDDDADLGFLAKGEARVLSQRTQLAAEGVVLSPWWGGHKLYFADGLPVPRHRHRFPAIDLYPSRVAGRQVRYARMRARWAFPHVYLDRDELWPLETRPFGPLRLPCPGRPALYLDRLYGPDWERVAYGSYDHRNEVTSLTPRVRLVDRAPAPFEPGE